MEADRTQANFWNTLERINQGANAVLVAISAVALISMAFMVTYDVFVRNVFNAPLPASVEISQLMEPYVVFLPFAYTLAIGAHVRVTLLTMRLPQVLFLSSEVLVYLLDLLFFSLLAYFSWQEFMESWAVDEIMLAAIKLPWWVGKFSMPLGMLFIALQCVVQLAHTIRAFKEL